MGFELTDCKLADACASIDYGYTASSQTSPTSTKFLRITDIEGGKIEWDVVPFVKADEAISRKYRLHHNDVVIARTGASTGRSALIQHPPDALFASYLVRLKINHHFDPRMIGYYLNSEEFWGYIRGVLGDKSAQPNASASTMTKAPLTVPRSLLIQRSIADVLGSLDNRIRSLSAVNRMLEAIARAIFKSWFVDFNPVRTKAEGREPEGMDAATAALFPIEFEESEIGSIPSGWGVSCFDRAVRITSGGTPKTTRPDYWDGDIPWFSIVDAPSSSEVFVIATEKRITQGGLESCSAILLPVGATIISARGTVGKLAITGVEMAINQSCYALLPSALGSYGTFFQTGLLVDVLRQRAHGAVFSTITRETLSSVSIVVPPSSIADIFEQTVAPLMQRILNGRKMAKTLAELRDTLLPRLISGKLRVPEAEKLVEAML